MSVSLYEYSSLPRCLMTNQPEIICDTISVCGISSSENKQSLNSGKHMASSAVPVVSNFSENQPALHLVRRIKPADRTKSHQYNEWVRCLKEYSDQSVFHTDRQSDQVDEFRDRLSKFNEIKSLSSFSEMMMLHSICKDDDSCACNVDDSISNKKTGKVVLQKTLSEENIFTALTDARQLHEKVVNTYIVQMKTDAALTSLDDPLISTR